MYFDVQECATLLVSKKSLAAVDSFKLTDTNLQTIDEVYIDGPCELFNQKEINRLIVIAEYFCNQEIPGPDRNANIWVGEIPEHGSYCPYL